MLLLLHHAKRKDKDTSLLSLGVSTTKWQTHKCVLRRVGCAYAAVIINFQTRYLHPRCRLLPFLWHFLASLSFANDGHNENNRYTDMFVTLSYNTSSGDSAPFWSLQTSPYDVDAIIISCMHIFIFPHTTTRTSSLTAAFPPFLIYALKTSTLVRVVVCATCILHVMHTYIQHYSYLLLNKLLEEM